MKDTDCKIQQEDEWTVKHTLTSEQLKKLFQNKIDRAKQATQHLKKRKDALFDDV